jgi:hypothetical protein
LSTEKKKIKNIDIVRVLGIPKTTLQDWKNNDGYLGILFFMLKSYTKEELIEKVEDIKRIIKSQKA